MPWRSRGCVAPTGRCGTILEPVCAFSSQTGADCRRGDDDRSLGAGNIEVVKHGDITVCATTARLQGCGVDRRKRLSHLGPQGACAFVGQALSPANRFLHSPASGCAITMTRCLATASSRGGTSSRGATATTSPAPRRRAGGAGASSGRLPRTSCRRAGPSILRSRRSLRRGPHRLFRISAAEAGRTARYRRRSRRTRSRLFPARQGRRAVASVSFPCYLLCSGTRGAECALRV